MPPEIKQGPLNVFGGLRTEKFGVGPSVKAEVKSGVIDYLGSYMLVSPEGGAADNLDTINGGEAGGLLFLSNGTGGGVNLVVKDGTGNLQIAGDFTMNSSRDVIVLMYRNPPGEWVEVCRSNNS
jgi:hypothetical protein